MSLVLTLLVALPLLCALVVLTADRARARGIACAGAGLVFLLALWAVGGGGQDLRAAYEGPAGLVEAALDRRGIEDPLQRSLLGRLLRERARPFESVAAELHELAELDLAVATLRDVFRLYPDDAPRHQRLRAQTLDAQAHSQRLLEHYLALERELGPVRQAAHSEQGLRFVHVARVPWIPALGVHWYLGLDGLSGCLVVLTALLALLGVTSSGGPSARPAVLASCLAIEAGLLLVYMALDLVVLHAAWTLLLLPMWGLLAAGDSERRAAVGLQAALPALAGAAVLLVVYAGVARLGGSAHPTFDVLALTEGAGQQSLVAQSLVFVGILAAVAPRLPLFPVHGWLRRVYEDLPGPAAVVLLGGGLPAGGYLLFRLAWPLAPDAVTTVSLSAWPTLPILAAGLGLFCVWFGASLALGERDVAGLASACGVTSAGWALLGLASLTPQGWGGAALVLVTQGLVGAVAALAREAGPADATVRPALGLALIGLVGLPGLAGFPALLSILVGLADSAVLAHPLAPPGWACFLAAAGGALHAFAIARWLRRPPEPAPGSGRPAALAALVPALVGLVVLGLWPRLILDAVAGAFTGFAGGGG